MNFSSLSLTLLNVPIFLFFLYKERRTCYQYVYFFKKQIVNSFFGMMKEIHYLLYHDPYGIFTNDEESEEIKPKKEIKYEEKYIDKYNQIEKKVLSTEEMDNLKYSVLFENKPSGNVLMYYDNKRETFVYYSDNNMPYRYLEVVARKYVVMNQCTSIYINMDFEIEEAKKKLDDKMKKKKEDDEKEKTEPTIKPKSVFAKLKNYNSGNNNNPNIPVRKPMNANQQQQQQQQPQKQPPQKQQQQQNNEFQILKENANRYSCEGKITNYSFLKKVDKKNVDKRQAMSFAEFKKMTIIL